MKWLIILLCSVVCAAIAFFPEALMWWAYGLIHPIPELGRIFTLIWFWILGCSTCLISATIGLYLWCVGVKTANEVF